MPDLSIRMHDGTLVEVPADLNAITTYVLLEQERWFEKETGFFAVWLKPGMTAIDIGANLGVYSLPMARLVGPEGQVFAYEPASETRRLLCISKDRNSAANLHISGAALSDRPREGRLAFGASSELNALGDGGAGESVAITTLDAEDAARQWPSIDVIKIDAEGEEERILKGSARFFARHSPLVMLEIKAGDTINETLRDAFVARGFGIYRLLGGAPVLVPMGAADPIDSFELNLFAAKPDRADALARDGFLVKTVPAWSAADAGGDPLALIRTQPFGPDLVRMIGTAPVDPQYATGLAAYAAWRSPSLPWPQRFAALSFANAAMMTACEKQPSLARLSTLARVSFEFGARGMSAYALKLVADLLKRGNTRLTEPFWPGSPRFDAIAPGGKLMEWFAVAALEQFELSATFSTRYGQSGIDLDWLAKQPFVSTEIGRRSVLRRAFAGQQTPVPKRLLTAADDHLNAELWRRGLVPNTLSGR